MELDDCEWTTSPEQKRTQDFLSLQNEKNNNKKKQKNGNLLLCGRVKLYNMQIKKDTM